MTLYSDLFELEVLILIILIAFIIDRILGGVGGIGIGTALGMIIGKRMKSMNGSIRNVTKRRG